MILRYVLKGIVLPPLAQIILFMVAWRLRQLKPRLARVMFLLALLSLWALSCPIIATTLALSLEKDPPIPPIQLKDLKADAIVILSASQNETSFEFGVPVSGEIALARLRYGAFVQRRTGLPVLLTGGTVQGNEARSLAETMSFDLFESFGIKARWLEEKSKTTAENARFSYLLLQPENRTTILLVTNSMHMMRAKLSFEQAGFRVIAAPTSFIDRGKLNILSFLPSAHSLKLSRDALHEWMGYVVYRMLS